MLYSVYVRDAKCVGSSRKVCYVPCGLLGMLLVDGKSMHRMHAVCKII